MIKLNLPAQTRQKLRQLFEVEEGSSYEFVGFKMELDTSIITDQINAFAQERLTQWHIQLLATLLSHYSQANPQPLSGNLVKFKDLPGGYAYERAFNRRAILPIAEFFGENSQELPRAGKLIGGIQLSHGDSSVQITALRGIPLTYILWEADEFAASASILYDQSASNYLPTEDLAVLGELTTGRLIEAKRCLPKE
jgi:hypothetical protein